MTKRMPSPWSALVSSVHGKLKGRSMAPRRNKKNGRKSNDPDNKTHGTKQYERPLDMLPLTTSLEM